MKDYKEMADNVLNRVDNYQKQKRKRHSTIKKFTLATSSVFLCVIFVFVIGKSNVLKSPSTTGSETSSALLENIEQPVKEYKNYQSMIDKKDIYSQGGGMLPSYTCNVTKPEELIDEDSIVIEAQIGDILESEISPNLSYPVTPMQIVSYKVLKGHLDENISKVYYSGGSVPIYKFINAFPQRANKMRIDTLSESDQKNKYLSFEMFESYDYSPGATYILIIKKNLDGRYFILVNAYGTFIKENSKYINVKTGNELIV